MDNTSSASKLAELRRSLKIAKRQIENRTAELEQINESLKVEIARHKRAEDELTLLFRLSQEICAAKDFQSAVDLVVRWICEATGWACGEAWFPCADETALVYGHGWYGESKSLERFKQFSRAYRFTPGVGMPGSVWVSKQPEWVQDISAEPRERHPRCELAKQFGLKSVFGIPILANDKTLAVLVFFMVQAREDDKHLVELVSFAAAQLGITLQHKQAEQSLREREALLQGIIDDSINIVWVKDDEGRYQFINRQCEEIFGISREQVKGKTDYDLLPKNVADELRANDRRVMEAGISMEFEERATRGDRMRTYISNKFPMRDSSGAVLSVCGIATDITERKRGEHLLEMRMEERTRELLEISNFNHAIIANMGEGLYTLDARGLVIYVNPAGERLFGWSRTELLGRKMHDVTHYRHPDGRHFPADECAGLQVLQKGAVLIDHEDVFIRKNGSFFPVVYSSSPISLAGAIVGLVVVFRDLTAQKQAEEALHRSREELRALAARLQEVREEERTVLAREIHDELSGTLTALKMDLALLPNRADKDRDLFLEKLNSMAGLIDGTLARVRTIATELRPIVLDKFGLVAAIEWLIGEFEDRSGVRCETRLPTEVIPLDPEASTAVFRILQEALTNVARHAHANKVVVELGSEAGSLILTVSDNGKGIDEQTIRAADSIGLLGMRERARSFGGTAEVTRSPGGGTLVSVRIPLHNNARLSQ
jgi:PAS domain S-box-containing protein